MSDLMAERIATMVEQQQNRKNASIARAEANREATQKKVKVVREELPVGRQVGPDAGVSMKGWEPVISNTHAPKPETPERAVANLRKGKDGKWRGGVNG